MVGARLSITSTRIRSRYCRGTAWLRAPSCWKDVVNLRRSETVQIAVPLRDFTGRTVSHCHIAEHEDQGMMGTLGVAPG